MKFRVAVKNAEGAESERVVEAASRFAVYEEIEKEGAQVAHLEEMSGALLPS